MRCGDRSVSISRRSWRPDLLLRGALPLHLLDPVAVAQQLEVLPRGEQQHEHEDSRPRRPTSTARAGAASSTSRTIGLLRTSFLMAYSKVRHAAPPVSPAPTPPAPPRAASRCAPAGCAALRRRPARSASSSAPRTGASRRCAERAQRVLHDPVLERVKRDHDEPRAGAQPPRGRLEERVEPVELAVHPDAQRLERARRRIDPLIARAAGPPAARSPPAAPVVVDRRLAPRRDDRARDAAREAFLAVARRSRRRAPLRSRRATRSAAVVARRCDPSACRAARRAGS